MLRVRPVTGVYKSYAGRALCGCASVVLAWLAVIFQQHANSKTF